MCIRDRVTEPGLELRLLRDVVVGPQHTQEDAFTEAPGTDEEQATSCLLYTSLPAV